MTTEGQKASAGRASQTAAAVSAAVSRESIERLIHTVRGYRVMLDSDLAGLYGVPTKRLNEQVTRNSDRFPEDFSFRLTEEEFHRLKSQNATSNPGRGGRRYLPRVITEHGALMAANVLRSPVAVETSVQVVRAFVHLREMVVSSFELSRRLDELEKRYDAQFKVVFDAIRQLMSPPQAPRIGFRLGEEEAKKRARSRKTRKGERSER